MALQKQTHALSPCNTTNDHADVLFRYSVFFRKLHVNPALVFESISHLFHLFFCELSNSVTKLSATRGSFLVEHVPDVIFLGPNKQVRRSNAAPVVTGVKNIHPVRYFSTVYLPGTSVRPDRHASFYGYLAIAARSLCPQPQPALICFFYTAKKPHQSRLADRAHFVGLH